jgi:hypothetical protein
MKKISFIVFVLLLVGCNGPYKNLVRGYHAVNYSARLVEDFDKVFAEHMRRVKANCISKHGAKTREFDQCVLPTVRISRTWTGVKNGKDTGKGVLPAIQSAQRVAKLALDTAYDIIKANDGQCNSAKCKVDWIGIMTPSLCMLAEIVDRAVKLGAYKVTKNVAYSTVMALVKTFTCPK